MVPILTIFTPTYNRCHLLKRLYKSLCGQTDDNFKWLIIDDGSTDDTKEIVDDMIKENIIPIEYVYKKNGGKHTAINLLLDIVETELVFTVDSDDYIDSDAVTNIIHDYDKYKDKNICMLVYRIARTDGTLVGKNIPDLNTIINYKEIIFNEIYVWDAAEIMVVNKWKKFRFPVYDNENFMGESVLAMQVYRECPHVYYSNKVIYYCDYLQDGLTKQGRAMRIKMPYGGMEYAKQYIEKGVNMHVKLKKTILYICYAEFAGFTLHKMAFGFPDKLLLLLCYIPGNVLHLIWRHKYRDQIQG